jgi:hypothetical protein
MFTIIYKKSLIQIEILFKNKLLLNKKKKAVFFI